MDIVSKKFVSKWQRPEDVVNAAKWAVSVDDLRLAFGGQQVLDGVSFTLPRGQTLLLRGGNGSGKTSLLNILSGFLRPDTGRIRLHIGGREINPARETPEHLARAGLGRLWQDIRLFPTMTAVENVLAATLALSGQNPFALLAKWPRIRVAEKEARERALYNLGLVGMADRAESSADMLSVGQMKRVALARLLQMEARIWLLDEPLAGLDQVSAKALIRLLEEFTTGQDRSILIIEHQHERVAPICDHILHLKSGRIHQAEAAA